ncbi:MAG: hypothetical protein RDV48_05830 [Candidatus Eremiobacteraeota bacterium]|nr:hypothetical protein [Candidatus Eremiobacteraeota bacterium]
MKTVVDEGSVKRNPVENSAALFVALIFLFLSMAGCTGGGSEGQSFLGTAWSGAANPRLDTVENLDKPGEPLRAGDWSRIRGSGFGDTQGQGYVHFVQGAQSSKAARYHAWADGEITFRTPDDLKSPGETTKAFSQAQIAIVHSSGSGSNVLAIATDATPNSSPQETPPAATPAPSPTGSPSPSPSCTCPPTPSPSPVPTATAAFYYVTDNPSNIDYRCGFSPDSSTIVFERTARGAVDYELYQVPATGGTGTPFLPQSFTKDYQSTRPNWSAANNQIAFTGSSRTGDSVWTVNPDGSGLVQVTSPEFRPIVDYPYWFPDGKSLAVVDYGYNPITNYKGIIRRVWPGTNPATVVNLTSDTQLLAGMPSVSPGGRYVAFAAQCCVNEPYNQNANSIYIIDLEAPAGTKPWLFDSGQARAPSWSPDGTVINFESNRGSPNPDIYAIYLKRFTGSPGDINGIPTKITEDSLNANHCVWSPKGTSLVMSAVLPASGSDPQAGSLPPPRGILVMDVPAGFTTAGGK